MRKFPLIKKKRAKGQAKFATQTKIKRLPRPTRGGGTKEPNAPKTNLIKKIKDKSNPSDVPKVN